MTTVRSTDSPVAAGLAGLAVALLAALLLSAAAGQARAAIDPEAMPPALAAEPAPILLEPMLVDPLGVVHPGIEVTIEVALLDVGPLLYGIMLPDEGDQGPPPWRRYVLMAAGWMGVFVLLVVLSVGSVEMRRQRRRRDWQSRVSGFYD